MSLTPFRPVCLTNYGSSEGAIAPSARIPYTSSMLKEETTTIQSVDRAMVLLKAIASRPQQGHTLGELTEVLDIDRSSIFRSLSTLIKHGLVRQEAGNKRYKLGYGIFQLAGALRHQDKLTDTARPFLLELVEKTGENAHLAVRSRSFCVFIDLEQGSQVLTANTDIGGSEELYCTAVGKSLICELSRKELDELLSAVEVKAFTDKTITDPDGIFEELQRVKERGYAVDFEEYEYNVVCLAGPIYTYERRVEASIGISGPKIRLEDRVEELGSIVRDISRRVSALLGYQG